ncbi:MAG: DUF4279 domain-containing protein [Hyphomicrobiaceae bacterium]
MRMRNRTTVRSSFAISGFDCDPSEITHALGIVPTRTSTEAPDRSGFKYWEFDQKEIDSVFVEEHVAKIIERLANSSHTIMESPIFKTKNVELNIFVIAKVSENDIGVRMCLSPEISKYLSDHCINLVIDG